MSVCMFIRTYRNDLDWLKYSLRSIAKFVSGLDEIVIAIPEHDREEIQKFGLTRERIVYVTPITDEGYRDQQYSKLMADTTTSCDFILHSDSDCIYHRPVHTDEFFQGGKPWMLMTPYEALGDKVPWKPITEKAVGKPVAFEFMRRLPLIYPRWLYQIVRNHISRVHGVSLEQYIQDQPGRALSEFNILGAIAYELHRDAFRWLNTDKDEMPPTCLKQFWSYSGVTPEIIEEMEKMLA